MRRHLITGVGQCDSLPIVAKIYGWVERHPAHRHQGQPEGERSKPAPKPNRTVAIGTAHTGKTPLRENGKPTLLTRRQILASGVAMAGTIPFLPITRATAAREPRTAKLRLTAGTRTLAVNGKPARVFGLIG